MGVVHGWRHSDDLDSSDVGNIAQHLKRGMVMTEWQPIETAPKDEWILVYQAHGQHGGMVFTGGHCYVAKWAYGNEFWYDKSSNILEIQDMKDHATTYFTCVPTHWMPLPLPPKKGDE